MAINVVAAIQAGLRHRDIVAVWVARGFMTCRIFCPDRYAAAPVQITMSFYEFTF